MRPQAEAKPLTSLQKWAYCLLAVAVAFCALQALRCGIVSGLRIGSLLRQQMAVSHIYQHAQTQQAYLQDKISLYSTSFGIEEMARERLGLVGEDEILVRLYPVATAQAQ
jgi:cell division protein FtsB